MKRVLAAALLAALAGPAEAQDVPDGIARQLPPGYDVLSSAAMQGGAFYVVALARQDEPPAPFVELAPARPLLLFTRQGRGFVPAGRNDHVVLRSNEGGQCNPFLDGGTIAVKGPYFTVENGVACGRHWTDYITFRFDAALGHFVFDNQRYESWVLNGSQAPGAPPLVRDGPARLRRGDPARPVVFDDWRPSP